MNKIETLIKELCPDGVEWKELNDVILSLNTGLNPRKFFKLNTPDANNYYITIKEIRNRQIKILENTDLINDEALRLCNNRSNLEVGDILFSGTGTIGQMVVIEEEPFNWNIKEGVYSIKPDCTKLNSHFLMYLLESEKIKQTYIKLKAGGTVQSIPMKALRGLKIPIPPLEIQEEIVKILDKFTDYVTELTTELTLRQKQYHYYQDELFTFENEEVEWKRFDEVCEIIRGNGLQKKDFVSEGVPCIHYGQIYTYYGITANETKSFVSNTVSEKLKKASYGDIILATTSENIEDVGKSLVWLGEEEVCIGGHSCILKTNQNSEYINHYLRTTQFQKQKERLVIGTKVIELYPKKIGTILIPIPSPETQLRISEILNGFNNLCNSFGEGLPKEIELRKKQYEYYRDKLLSFD